MGRMGFDYTELGKKCALDSFIIEQAQIHKSPILEYYKTSVTNDVRKEICRDCDDHNCSNYREFRLSDTNAKRKSN